MIIRKKFPCLSFLCLPLFHVCPSQSPPFKPLYFYYSYLSLLAREALSLLKAILKVAPTLPEPVGAFAC